MGKQDIYGTKTRHKEGVVMFKKDGTLYNKMKELTKTERAVLDFMVKTMEDDMNVVVMAGDTVNDLHNQISITEGSLRVVLSKLKKEGFIDKTVLPHEYLVSPLLAVAGSEYAVYTNMERLEKELQKKHGTTKGK